MMSNDRSWVKDKHSGSEKQTERGVPGPEARDVDTLDSFSAMNNTSRLTTFYGKPKAQLAGGQTQVSGAIVGFCRRDVFFYGTLFTGVFVRQLCAF